MSPLSPLRQPRFQAAGPAHKGTAEPQVLGQVLQEEATGETLDG